MTVHACKWTINGQLLLGNPYIDTEKAVVYAKSIKDNGVRPVIKPAGLRFFCFLSKSLSRK